MCAPEDTSWCLPGRHIFIRLAPGYFREPARRPLILLMALIMSPQSPVPLSPVPSFVALPTTATVFAVSPAVAPTLADRQHSPISIQNIIQCGAPVNRRSGKIPPFTTLVGVIEFENCWALEELNGDSSFCRFVTLLRCYVVANLWHPKMYDYVLLTILMFLFSTQNKIHIKNV